MRKVFFLKLFCLAFATCLFCGCSPDDENDNNSSSTTATTTQKVTSPKFDKYLTTTDLDGFSIRVRFKCNCALEKLFKKAKLHPN